MMKDKKNFQGSAFWQIIFPALVGILLTALLCVWIVLDGKPADISRFAEISTILLVIPVIIVSLLSFVILGFLIYLIQRMIIGIPPFTIRVLDFLDGIKSASDSISAAIVQPVISPLAILAGIRKLFSKKGTRFRIE
jgi:hypothetical protein